MKKRIQDILLALIIFAVICALFWHIGWISSVKEIAILYAILVLVVGTSIFIDVIKKKLKK